MRRFLVACALISLAVLSSCQDNPLPTDPDTPGDDAAQTPGRRGPPVGRTDPGAPEGEINQLLTALFSPRAQRDAKTGFADVKSSLAQGDQAGAEEAMRDLVNLVLDAFGAGELQDPGGPAAPTTLAAVEELVDLLYEFVGLTPPDFDLEAVQDLQQADDFAVELVGDEGATVVTNTEFAGVDIEDGDISEDVLVTIERLDPTEQPGGFCLPTGSPQAEGCYLYERSPAGDFDDVVAVGICIDESVPDWEDYLLHKFDPDNPGDGVQQLDPTNVTFLDCTDFEPLVSASANGNGFWTLASAGLKRLLRRGGEFLVPPLRAAHAGPGGFTLSFSRIGWAEAAQLNVVSGNNQTAEPGETLADPLVLSVTETHDHDPTADVVEGALVTFDVIGDATLGGLTEEDTNPPPHTNLVPGEEGTTDADGEISVPVTLGAGASGTVTVRAHLAGADNSPLEFEITVEPEEEPAQIAFRSDLPGDLWIMDEDGTNASNLTNSNPDERGPAWSPAGNHIAFFVDSDGDDKFEIWVMDADGSNPTQLTDDTADDRYPRWSPDGTEIAFSSRRNGGFWEIWVMDADGNNPTQLTDDNSALGNLRPDWAPNEDDIVFDTGRYGTADSEIAVLSRSNPPVDGGPVERLTNNADSDQQARFSPDGLRIAFHTDRDAGDIEVYVMDFDGGNPTRVTTSAGIDTDPSWSDDGTQVLFASNRGGDFDIFLVDPDNPVALVGGFGFDGIVDRSPAFRPEPFVVE